MAVLLVAAASGSAAPTDQLGHPGPEFASFGVEQRGGPATGQKPESKLWYQQDRWWAVMPSAAFDGRRTIHRLHLHRWLDTKVVVDERPDTKEDVLVAGGHVYILSRASKWSGDNFVRRYSYVDGRYVLDEGFPVTAPGAGAEAATIARDSTGVLWLAYEIDGIVFVARTDDSGVTWREPAPLPHEGARTVNTDDIAAAVSFVDDRGPAVGVLWSNQPEGRQYFTVHRDGAPDTEWELEVALEGDNAADDHLSVQATESGVFAAVKTSHKEGGEASIRLLVRAPNGEWSSHIVSLVKEHHTRPHLQIHLQKRKIYVFGTITEKDSQFIGYKVADLDDRFFPGHATPVIRSSTAIDNATGAKQLATTDSGVMVLAGDGVRYHHNALPDAVFSTACRRNRASQLKLTEVLAASRWDALLCLTWWGLVSPLYGHSAEAGVEDLARRVSAGIADLMESDA